jgi:hypothetical protein
MLWTPTWILFCVSARNRGATVFFLQAKLDAYNSAVVHETLRVAVIENISRRDSMPPQLREAMLEMFPELVSGYIETCQRLAPTLDSSSTDNPVGGPKVTFGFAALQMRLEGLVKSASDGTLS